MLRAKLSNGNRKAPKKSLTLMRALEQGAIDDVLDIHAIARCEVRKCVGITLRGLDNAFPTHVLADRKQ